MNVLENPVTEAWSAGMRIVDAGEARVTVCAKRKHRAPRLDHGVTRTSETPKGEEAE